MAWEIRAGARFSPAVHATDATAAASTTSDGDGRGEQLADRVVNGESFWRVVREPYLKRRISRDEARDAVRRLVALGGGTYVGMAKRLGLEAEYKKLVNFLDYHDLRIRR